MKTIKLLLLLTLLLSPLLVSAYQGQYSWDPIYFEEVKDPFDSLINFGRQMQAENQQTINRLKSRYGITDYYTCRNAQSGCNSSDPGNQSRCLIVVEFCLERKQIQDERIEECKSKGYLWNNGQCINKDQACKFYYGQYSYYTNKENSCGCLSGYKWNNQRTGCVIAPIVPVKTNDEICSDAYGLNSNWNGTKNDNDQIICDCKISYKWNEQRTNCIKEIKKPVEVKEKTTILKEISKPKPKIENRQVLGVQVDMNLSKRLSGKLLLQVEQGGSIWYVDTNEYNRYSVTWANALPLFEKLSLGITDSDLSQIPVANSQQIGNWSLRNRLKGRLLLQVEQRGAIWYVDQDGYRHSVTWNNLMPLFESLALGITNNDLYKIPVGSLD
ncbi:hypothetical protein KKA66_02725 [Patescibacteria group bacterium]|nr:hypothetical protein [Patescibacteria group bacterium]